METVRVRPERTTLAVVLVMLLGSLPLGLSSPFLAPVFLLPLAALVWVLRARVIASVDGLEICNGLAVRRVRWPDVDRFDIRPRGPVVLHPTEGPPVRLTALQRRDLPRLIAVGQPA